MSQEEKNNYISLITSFLITVPYIIYTLLRFQDKNLNTDEELKFWATAILIMIPIRIIAQILMYIIVTIITAIATGKEPVEEKADERDNIIGLKATRNAYFTFCLGFLLAIIMLALGKSVSTMFGIFLITGFISELIEVGSKICYYRRGI